MRKSLFKQFLVKREENGLPLSQWIKKLFPDLSQKKIKRLVEEKVFFINRLPEKFSQTRLKEGDLIWVDEKRITEKVYSTTLFENEAFLVLNKAPFFVSDDERQVHRLDKETSGVYLLAKTAAAKTHLERQFKERKVKKEYRALCIGHFPSKKGKRESYLQYIVGKDGQKMGRESFAEKGVLALTEYEILRSKGKLHDVACFPMTGRMHQIRLHMKGLGAPILGDEKYGGEEVFPFYVPRVMLHASQITFQDPITSTIMTITAPLPDDYEEILSCKF